MDPSLALAVAAEESGFDQRRVSSANAIGVMQVVPVVRAAGRPASSAGRSTCSTPGTTSSAGVAILAALRAAAPRGHRRRRLLPGPGLGASSTACTPTPAGTSPNVLTLRERYRSALAPDRPCARPWLPGATRWSGASSTAGTPSTARIARGGMATVYLALDRRLDRDVALKVMHAHLADDPQFTARFIREARSAARLSHPGVVAVFDQGEDDGLLYLAMEYLQGRTPARGAR